jgi:hypothetical protein
MQAFLQPEPLSLIREFANCAATSSPQRGEGTTGAVRCLPRFCPFENFRAIALKIVSSPAARRGERVKIPAFIPPSFPSCFQELSRRLAALCS